MSTHIITGGAGFVGANLAASLLADQHTVIAIDDLSRGREDVIAPLYGIPEFSFRKADCSNFRDLMAALEGYEGADCVVWHLAANSDIPAGVADPRIDLERTFMTTFVILEVMKAKGMGTLHFASSSAIYGDFGDTEIHEDIGPLQPISNYGAMKLASEAQIRAASEAWLKRASIFRFPNVIGIPATHGVIWDFVRKLKADDSVLEVLGDGTQQKAYLHIDDLVSAMRFIARLDGAYLVYNIGPVDAGITVREIAEAVRDRVNTSASIRYGKENRGWVGDVPRFRYSVDNLLKAGWRPTLSSHEAVRQAVGEIAGQELVS